MVIQGDEDMFEAYFGEHGEMVEEGTARLNAIPDEELKQAFEDWASNTEPEPVEIPDDLYDREDLTHELGEDN